MVEKFVLQFGFAVLHGLIVRRKGNIYVVHSLVEKFVLQFAFVRLLLLSVRNQNDTFVPMFGFG